MAKAKAPQQIVTIHAHETEVSRSMPLGTKVYGADGTIYRYAKAGASAISAGKLQLAPAPKTNHHNIAVAVSAEVNDVYVTVTLGATLAVANEYAEGWLIISDAAGEGYRYQIDSHPAADASATLKLKLKDSVMVALTTSSEATLVHNAWNGTVEGTSTTRQPAGVAEVAVEAEHYYLSLVRGVVGVLADSTITLGDTVVAGSATAGAIDSMSDTPATAIAQIAVGEAIVAGVDTEYRPVLINID